MKINFKKLQMSLTSEEIISLVYDLGANRHIEKSDLIIFPTICHNEDAAEASMKLYYYKESHMFHCYTECSDSFNIYELIKRVLSLRQIEEVSFRQVFDWLKSKLSLDDSEFSVEKDKYKSQRYKFARKERQVKMPTYPHDLINVFSNTYPQEWIKEGISKKTMDKYNIRFSIAQNKIIIPHYDINGNLIGIRGRALDQKEIDNYGKYMPVKIENTLYAHPLSQNLYGLNFSCENIKKKGICFLFEAEKSVMMYDSYYQDNLSAAVCGSSFNKVQLDILMRHCGPKEIVICFDNDHPNLNNTEGLQYFNKLWELGKKYAQYVNISFIFDRDNLLDLKDSPIDKGKDIFEQLVNKRIKTWKVL